MKPDLPTIATGKQLFNIKQLNHFSIWHYLFELICLNPGPGAAGLFSPTMQTQLKYSLSSSLWQLLMKSGATTIITLTFLPSAPLPNPHTYTALRWCPVSQEMMVRIHLPAQVHPLQDLRASLTKLLWANWELNGDCELCWTGFWSYKFFVLFFSDFILSKTYFCFMLPNSLLS